MANFDDNIWYYITANISSTLALYGPGSVFFSAGYPTNHGQQWQIFPYNETYYVLRNSQLGPAEAISMLRGADFVGGVPAMFTIPEADLSMYWAITPWGDGTYYMTNPVNGSDWHLNVAADNTSNLLMDISSNITAPQDGQRFTFPSISEINDKAFSTAETPPGTVLAFTASSASTSTSSFTDSSTRSPSVVSSHIITSISTMTLTSSTSSLSLSTFPLSSTSSHNSGLSPGASAGIGVSVAVAVLLAGILVVLLFLRRREHKISLGQRPQADKQMNTRELASKGTNSLSEDHNRPQAQSYEMEGIHAWEMEGHSQAWELDESPR